MPVLARRPDTGGFYLIGSQETYMPGQADVDALIRAGFVLHPLAADDIDKVGWLLRKVG